MKEIPGKPGQLDQISSKAPSFKREKTFSGQGQAFGKILSEQFNTPLETDDSTIISKGLPELEGSYKAATINLADRQDKLTEKISASIDLLDAYASMLSDPETSLKQAYKFLEDLSGKTSQLNQELDQSPKTDQSLKQIITHLTAMVQVEQIKIDRGDYSNLT